MTRSDTPRAVAASATTADTGRGTPVVPSTAAGPVREPIRSPEVIRAEIALTRAELSETVSALAARTDVKARTQDAVAELTEQAKDAARSAVHRPTMWVAVGTALAAMGGIVWWRRRR